MGKRLIIKDANFSANAIDRVIEDMDITSLLTFVKGINGASMSSNASRAGIRPRLDISSYMSQGYTKTKVVLKKNGITVFLGNSANKAVGEQHPQVIITDRGDGYGNAGTYINTIEGGANVYVGCNINLTEAGDYENLSDYMSVILTT